MDITFFDFKFSLFCFFYSQIWIESWMKKVDLNLFCLRFNLIVLSCTFFIFVKSYQNYLYILKMFVNFLKFKKNFFFQIFILKKYYILNLTWKSETKKSLLNLNLNEWKEKRKKENKKIVETEHATKAFNNFMSLYFFNLYMFNVTIESISILSLLFESQLLVFFALFMFKPSYIFFFLSSFLSSSFCLLRLDLVKCTNISCQNMFLFSFFFFSICLLSFQSHFIKH